MRSIRKKCLKVVMCFALPCRAVLSVCSMLCILYMEGRLYINTNIKRCVLCPLGLSDNFVDSTTLRNHGNFTTKSQKKKNEYM